MTVAFLLSASQIHRGHIVTFAATDCCLCQPLKCFFCLCPIADPFPVQCVIQILFFQVMLQTVAGQKKNPARMPSPAPFLWFMISSDPDAALQSALTGM